MSSDIAIEVENLSKRYVLGHQQGEAGGYVSLRDLVTQTARGLARSAVHALQRKSAPRSETSEEFWALKDVSFEVRRGEALGIIGRNGAGKSTLLKILSRITEPTSGRVHIRGRVASLLEVGTGFHPELTGRENIYLNGAILGMTRVDVRRKFDQIVDFAGVERFIDTPVKRYSSGMYVRLAFAVAAHLEPDILVVDEVLAVGDHEFQQRCIGRMEAVSASEGRTVVFVSHNSAALSRLCPRSIRLENGAIVDSGVTSDVLDRYHRAASDRTSGFVAQASTKGAAILEVVMHGGDVTRSELRCDTPVHVDVKYRLQQKVPDLHLSAGITDRSGTVIFGSNPVDADVELPNDPGVYLATFTIPAELLLPQRYGLTVGLWSSTQGGLDAVEGLTIEPQWAETFATRNYVKKGLLAIRCEWKVTHAG